LIPQSFGALEAVCFCQVKEEEMVLADQLKISSKKEEALGGNFDQKSTIHIVEGRTGTSVQRKI
jgi:hypothetical protein